MATVWYLRARQLDSTHVATINCRHARQLFVMPLSSFMNVMFDCVPYQNFKYEYSFNLRLADLQILRHTHVCATATS